MEKNEIIIEPVENDTQIWSVSWRCKYRDYVDGWPPIKIETNGYGNGNGNGNGYSNGNGAEAVEAYEIVATPKQKTPTSSTTIDRSKEAPSAALQSTFESLAEQWRKETGYLSSIQAILTSQPYLKIIGMGEPVVWLILEELKTRPDYWFWALESITREDPVQAEHRGNLMLMTADWLEWGRRHGYP